MKKDTTPNFWPDRGGNTIKAIVVHTCDCSFGVCANTIKNPSEEKSYHYIIDTDGEVTQFVPIEAAAWHCGKVVKSSWKGLIAGVNPNLYTVGVALAGVASQDATPRQMVALCTLLSAAAAEVGVGIDANTIVFHREIQGEKTCPAMGITKDGVLHGIACIRAIERHELLFDIK